MNNILHFIAIFAFTLGIIAPACGFAWGSRYSVVEVCTAQGIENRIVENDSAPAEHQKVTEQCQFCFAQSNIDFQKSLPNTTLTPYLMTLKVKAQQFAVVFLSKTKHPQASRAPPFIL